LDNIKYCKTIDYLEWVVSLMSGRYELVGVIGRVSEPQARFIEFKEAKSIVVQKR
jgi:hypothetical protein